MKKYMKPEMESETFVTNEFIGACGDQNYGCINMNDANYVFFDENGDNLKQNEESFYATTIGSGDKSQNVTFNSSYQWLEVHDCGQNGDESAGKHNIGSISGYQKVCIVFNDDSVAQAIVDTAQTYTDGNWSHKIDNPPHFIRIKTINASG